MSEKFMHIWPTIVAKTLDIAAREETAGVRNLTT